MFFEVFSYRLLLYAICDPADDIFAISYLRVHFAEFIYLFACSRSYR